jgi:hypothetical protein
MIDRLCPTCRGRAEVTIFKNEHGKVAKLWKCQLCLAVWGVPEWDYVAHDLAYDFGLAPWTKCEDSTSLIGKQSPLVLNVVTTCYSRRPFVIALLVILMATVLLLRHWLP